MSETRRRKSRKRQAAKNTSSIISTNEGTRSNDFQSATAEALQTYMPCLDGLDLSDDEKAKLIGCGLWLTESLLIKKFLSGKKGILLPVR